MGFEPIELIDIVLPRAGLSHLREVTILSRAATGDCASGAVAGIVPQFAFGRTRAGEHEQTCLHERKGRALVQPRRWARPGCAVRSGVHTGLASRGRAGMRARLAGNMQARLSRRLRREEAGGALRLFFHLSC